MIARSLPLSPERALFQRPCHRPAIPADSAGGFRHCPLERRAAGHKHGEKEKQCCGVDGDFHSCLQQFIKVTRHRIAGEMRNDDFTAAAAELGRVRRIEEQSFESISERAGVTVGMKNTAAGEFDQFRKGAIVGLHDGHPGGERFDHEQSKSFARARGHR